MQIHTVAQSKGVRHSLVETSTAIRLQGLRFKPWPGHKSETRFLLHAHPTLHLWDHNIGYQSQSQAWKLTIHKWRFIHSFIHYGDLYSAPSRLLLRSAPDPCTAKEKSFESRVKCVRKNPREQSLRRRKPIPHRGANHQECTGLGCGGTSKRNKE